MVDCGSLMDSQSSRHILLVSPFCAALAIFSDLYGLQHGAVGLMDSKNLHDTNAVKIGILCGQLIDGKSEVPLKNAAILIEGEKIISIGSAKIIPPEAQNIDWGGATLLRGVSDSH